MSVFIPAFSRKDFSHLARVDELIGLCGFTTARNNLVLPSVSSDLRLFVLDSYTCSVLTGQRIGL